MVIEYEYKNTFTIKRFRDGDTLEGFLSCTHCGHSNFECVRLPKIDSWEPKGPDAARASRVAEQLTETYRGITGTLLSNGKKRDKYGRLIGDIQIGDYSLQLMIVNAGLAWWGVGAPKPDDFETTFIE